MTTFKTVIHRSPTYSSIAWRHSYTSSQELLQRWEILSLMTARNAPWYLSSQPGTTLQIEKIKKILGTVVKPLKLAVQSWKQPEVQMRETKDHNSYQKRYSNCKKNIVQLSVAYSNSKNPQQLKKIRSIQGQRITLHTQTTLIYSNGK